MKSLGEMNWTERKKKFGHQFEVERRGEETGG